jgi:hypothetical protein
MYKRMYEDQKNKIKNLIFFKQYSEPAHGLFQFLL